MNEEAGAVKIEERHWLRDEWSRNKYESHLGPPNPGERYAQENDAGEVKSDTYMTELAIWKKRNMQTPESEEPVKKWRNIVSPKNCNKELLEREISRTKTSSPLLL